MTGTLVMNGDVIAKNANYIGGYLKTVVDAVLENYNKRPSIKRLDTKRFFEKSFNMGGANPLELAFGPYLKEVEGQRVQPSKASKLGSNDVTLFAYSFDCDKKEDGNVKDEDIVWLLYNADDWDNAKELNKDLFAVVRDHYSVMIATSHTLDKSNEVGYQQTLVRLGDIQENAQYCAERGLVAAPPAAFQEQFAMSELFANVVQVMFAMTEDAVNGKEGTATNRATFVGIVDYVADQQKLITNVYGGGFGMGAQPTFAQQLYAAQTKK